VKRIGVISFIFLFAFSIEIEAKNGAINGGFGMSFIIGFPSTTYGFDAERITEYSEYQVNNFWGLQMGNSWYFKTTENFGLGLMSNWLDITIGSKHEEGGGNEWRRLIVDVSLIEIGPLATVALTNDLVFDAFYNFRPTFVSSALFTYDIDDIKFGTTGFGISHTIGIALRYSVLSIGIDYVIGDIKSREVATDNFSLDLGTSNVDVNSFRLNLGFRF
jgi:hypothetical protein